MFSNVTNKNVNLFSSKCLSFIRHVGSGCFLMMQKMIFHVPNLHEEMTVEWKLVVCAQHYLMVV